jgi:acetyl-CoA carboxylase carboxyl transferase subunit alpha
MSKRHFLEFEQPIAELDAKIEELRYVQNESAVDISEEIERLDKTSRAPSATAVHAGLHR